MSTGIYRAKALENTSRTARDILQALESGFMVRKLDEVTDTVLGRATFVPGPTRWIATGLKVTKQSAKEATDPVKLADRVMASDEFNRALQVAAEGRVKEADALIKKSKAWQAWRGAIGEGTAKQLASMGPIAWLTQQEEPQETEAAPVEQ